MRYTEKNLGDIAFWRDSGSIENYANSLLRYCEKEINLKIIVSGSSSTPRCSYRGDDRFLIELPKPQDHYIDIKNQDKDILARKVFLKHELAHILFSDFSLFNDHHCSVGTSFHFLWNALEDVRIENLFGKKFSGANDSFFEVQDMYFNKSKKGIENSKLDVQSLALYFIFRSKGKNFKVTSSTKLYENLFSKYGNFIDLDASELKNLIGKILSEFESTQKAEKEKQEENTQSNDPLKEQALEGEQEDSNEDQESGEGEPNEGDSDESPDSEDSDSQEGDGESGESDSMNDSEPQDSIQDDSQEGEQESNEDQESEGESSEESNTNNTDTQSMIQDLMNSVSQDEKESFKDSFDESEAKKEKEILDEELKGEILLNKGLSSPKDEEILFYKNLLGMLNNFCSFKEGELNAKESKIVPMRRYYKKVLSSNGREDIFTYNEIVKKNKKNIVGLTNYFKLRFQNKERNKYFHNREEGIINNNDLFKILIKNKNENTIFSKIESSVVNKSNILFLLDFSSSMKGDNIQSVIETMIVMNEVFSKLKIPYEMYSFSGSHDFKLKYSKKIKSVSNLFDSSVLIKADERKLGLSSLSLKDSGKFPLFQLRSVKDNEYSTDKKILGKLYNESKSGGPLLCQGNTPEMEAVISLRKNIHFSNKKLFILNDGEYNTTYSDSRMSEEQKTLIGHESKYVGIPSKILHSLLNEKSFILNSPTDIDIFKNIAFSLKNVLGLGNPFDRFYRSKELQSTKVKEVIDFVNALSLEFSDLDYNALLKKDKIKIGSFGVIKVNVSNKNISLSFKVNESAFSILNTEPEFGGETSGTYSYIRLGQKEWDWNCISTLICYSCITRGQFYSYELINDRMYRSLIDKMRNEGWGVYGLGINSRKGKKYIGEKYFTTIKSSEITETLTKNIREIV